MIAYLDGGTVSMVMAAVAAGFAGVAVLVRMYWYRGLGVFSKKHRAKADAARDELLGQDQS